MIFATRLLQTVGTALVLDFFAKFGDLFMYSDAQILKETLCFCERLDIQHSSSEHQDEKENVIKLLCKEYQTFKEALLNEMKLVS